MALNRPHLARIGATKEEIRHEISTRFTYDLDRTIEAIRPDYSFDVTCQGRTAAGTITQLCTRHPLQVWRFSRPASLAHVTACFHSSLVSRRAIAGWSKALYSGRY